MAENSTLLQKADIALADLVGHGELNPEMTDTFIRTLIDSPTILNTCRVVTMNAPTRKVNKIGFGTRIMHAATSATALAADKRSKPDLSQIELNTKEGIAELWIPYDVMEDNIERGSINASMGESGGGLMTVITQLIAERAALDLEELLINGDTNNPDDWLGMFDGYMKRASAHVVNAGGATINKDILKAGVKAMPDKYLRNRSRLIHYVSVDNETEYRDTYANRQTALGDNMLQGTGPIYAYGSQLESVPLMPNTKGLYTDPLNLLFGIQRRVTMEYDKDIRARVYIIVLTCRVCCQIEETDAVVTYSAIG